MSKAKTLKQQNCLTTIKTQTITEPHKSETLFLTPLVRGDRAAKQVNSCKIKSSCIRVLILHNLCPHRLLYILGNRAGYAHALSPVERVLGHFKWNPSPMSVTIRRQKLILLLKFACNTDLGPKKLVAWSINDNFVLQN